MFASDESILTDAEFISCGWAHFFPYISGDNINNESVSFHFINKYNFLEFYPFSIISSKVNVYIPSASSSLNISN